MIALALALRLAAGAPAPATSPCAATAEAELAFCQAVAARPRLPLPTAADRAALEEVLARPELRRARVDTAGLRRALAALWLRVLELFGSVEAERYASAGRTVFLVAALAAGVAALAAARRRRWKAAPRGRAPGAVEAPSPSPDRSLDLAQAALSAGDPSSALRHAFLAALSALEAAGVLPRDRALTNGELARRIGPARGPMGDDFAALGRAFDEAIYGRRPVGEPQARAAVDAALRIRAASGGTA